MHNRSSKNEFNLHVNEISFSYERIGTKAQGKRVKVLQKWPVVSI